MRKYPVCLCRRKITCNTEKVPEQFNVYQGQLSAGPALTRGIPGEVDLPVLGVDDVELRQLELPLVPHGQGGVVPPVAHLGAGVGD